MSVVENTDVDVKLAVLDNLPLALQHDYKLLKQKIVNGELGEINIIKITNRGFTNNTEKAQKAGEVFYNNLSDFLLRENQVYIDLIEDITGLDIVKIDMITNSKNKSAVINLSLSNNALAYIDTSLDNSVGFEHCTEVFGRNATVIIDMPRKNNLRTVK
jgi:predicted dehydrogenase